MKISCEEQRDDPAQPDRTDLKAGESLSYAE